MRQAMNLLSTGHKTYNNNPRLKNGINLGTSEPCVVCTCSRGPMLFDRGLLQHNQRAVNASGGRI